MSAQASRFRFKLSPELIPQLARLGRVDLVVGIPSYNNASTIRHVVRAVSYGLAKYFSQHRAVIVNSDGGSTDGTREVFAQAGLDADVPTLLTTHPVSTAPKLSTVYHGTPGKGSAFRTIFKAMTVLHAKAGIVVDADLRSISPEWVELLAGPVLLKGYDFVAPFYARHKYDGTITNMIAYPLTRALYGYRVRQPIGGDFGFSRRLAERYLRGRVWGTDVARFGIDIWMTTLALSEGYRVCQAFLGEKVHDAKDPAKSLGPMFQQVIGTLFVLMKRYADRWRKVRGSVEVPCYGFRRRAITPPLRVDLAEMIARFQAGYRAHRAELAEGLPSERLTQLDEVAGQAQAPDEGFVFPPSLWVELVYDCAVAFQRAEAEQRHALLEALLPLYLGRTAAFVAATKGKTAKKAEGEVEAQCRLFESLKPSLVQRWNALLRHNRDRNRRRGASQGEGKVSNRWR